MSWNDEQSILNATGQWHVPTSAESQRPNPSAGPVSNSAFVQLDYAAQDAALYPTDEQNSLWPYEIGLDPAYSIPGSSVSSMPVDEIDWQGILDSGEGPSPSSEDKTKRSRRQEQNRAAQRAFRERKDRALLDLQKEAKSSKDRAAKLEAENARLRDKIKESKVEIDTLRSVSIPSQALPKGLDDVGLDVSCKRVTDQDEDVLLVRIKLGEAEDTEK